MDVRVADLADAQVAALLALHFREAHAGTPAGFAHALPAAALAAPDVILLAAWHDGTLMGLGALRELDRAHGEIKSMRTAPTALRRGTARAILTRLIALARARGYARISLETGTGPGFAPANHLYRAFGFVDGPVFGGYPASVHNRFMTLELEP